MNVVAAQPEDFTGFLALAAEVETLFGPMVGDPGFHQAVRRNIDRGTAYCIREADGPPGEPLVGGLLFSPRPPRYVIGWLVVAARHARSGAGRLLVAHALAQVRPPAEVEVTTFGPEIPAGAPARAFYQELGFQPGEMTPADPKYGSRQVFHLKILPPS